VDPYVLTIFSHIHQLTWFHLFSYIQQNYKETWDAILIGSDINLFFSFSCHLVWVMNEFNLVKKFNLNEIIMEKSVKILYYTWRDL